MVAVRDAPVPLVVTPGEPAGIGPDLLVIAASQGACGDVVAVADPALLQERAQALGLRVSLHESAPGRPLPATSDGTALCVWPVALAAKSTPGTLDPANGAYVLECLRRAADACLHGQAGALVTGPVQKSVINDAGLPFTGHTEFLAQHCGGALPVMLLVAPDADPSPLRVALATTHVPLRAVADSITTPLIRRVTEILHAGLRRDFGIDAPRIKVTGLNPHAGESGHLGREELDVIVPAIRQLQAQGIRVSGPFPADTLFTPHHLADCDAVLAMYHDQGLPTLKYAGFGTAVNVTLGLPLVRVSVDHGTALDLAATGRIHHGSFLAALRVARSAQQARASATA